MMYFVLCNKLLNPKNLDQAQDCIFLRTLFILWRMSLVGFWVTKLSVRRPSFLKSQQVSFIMERPSFELEQ
jgi:hypothetical protein